MRLIDRPDAWYMLFVRNVWDAREMRAWPPRSKKNPSSKETMTSMLGFKVTTCTVTRRVWRSNHSDVLAAARR